MSSFDVRAGLVTVDTLDVVGVSIKTQNKNDRAVSDINALWERFFSEGVGQKIPDKFDDTIYAVYSDYEGGHEDPYRLTIGYRVRDVVVPDGLKHVQVSGGDYAVLSAAGEQPKVLIQTWEAIWSSDLNRSFKSDFEVYGPRFFEDGVNEVLVHVGVQI